MMGNRGWRGAGEYDAFSRRGRYLWRGWKRGELRKLKRAYAKRQRRLKRKPDLELVSEFVYRLWP